MNIYLLNMLFIMIYMLLDKLIYASRISFNKPESLSKRKTFFLGIVFLQMWLILSLRHWSVGTDTISYKLGFEYATQINWLQVFDLSEKNIMFNFERGFVLFTVILKNINDNFNFYLSIASIIIIFPIYFTIKKYSAIPLLSVFLYITLNFYHFSMSGMRQAMALSIVFFSYKYLIENKNFKFIVCILIASTLHFSALFFIISLFLKKFKFTPSKIVFYFLMLLSIFFFREKIFSLVSLIYYGIEKETYNTGAYTLLLIVLMVFMGALMFYKSTIFRNKSTILLYNIVAIVPILMIFNSISQSSLRLANYFYIFIILLIPEVLISLKLEEKFFSFIILLTFCLVFYIISGMYFLNTGNYLFFWQ